MLPLKWKIFRLLNFIHFSIAFILFVIFAWYLIDTNFPFPDFFFILPPLVAGCNCYFNLHILRRYFPDRLLSNRFKNFTVILFILNLLAGFTLIGLIYLGAESEFSSGSEPNPTGKIILVALTLILVLHIYILIVQFQVSSFLKNNNRNNIEKLIDSIGSSG